MESIIVAFVLNGISRNVPPGSALGWGRYINGRSIKKVSSHAVQMHKPLKRSAKYEYNVYKIPKKQNNFSIKRTPLLSVTSIHQFSNILPLGHPLWGSIVMVARPPIYPGRTAPPLLGNNLDLRRRFGRCYATPLMGRLWGEIALQGNKIQAPPTN